MSAGHGGGPTNKKVALFITFLALLLALSETLAKSSQTYAISSTIEASRLWAFFQAKTIRMTDLSTSVDALEVEALSARSKAAQEAIAKKIEASRQRMTRYESEPETGEGRKELMEKARAAEAEFALSMAKYHLYEIAAAAFEIAIVLASSTIVTEAAWLLFIAGGFGISGAVFTGLALFAPGVMAMFH